MRYMLWCRGLWDHKIRRNGKCSDSDVHTKRYRDRFIDIEELFEWICIGWSISDDRQYGAKNGYTGILQYMVL